MLSMRFLVFRMWWMRLVSILSLYVPRSWFVSFFSPTLFLVLFVESSFRNARQSDTQPVNVAFLGPVTQRLVFSSRFGDRWSKLSSVQKLLDRCRYERYECAIWRCALQMSVRCRSDQVKSSPVQLPRQRDHRFYVQIKFISRVRLLLWTFARPEFYRSVCFFHFNSLVIARKKTERARERESNFILIACSRYINVKVDGYSIEEPVASL